MQKIFSKEVDQCAACPNRLTDGKCLKSYRYLHSFKRCPTRGIPPWCPLEDADEAKKKIWDLFRKSNRDVAIADKGEVRAYAKAETRAKALEEVWLILNPEQNLDVEKAEEKPEIDLSLYACPECGGSIDPRNPENTSGVFSWFECANCMVTSNDPTAEAPPEYWLKADEKKIDISLYACPQCGRPASRHGDFLGNRGVFCHPCWIFGIEEEGEWFPESWLKKEKPTSDAIEILDRLLNDGSPEYTKRQRVARLESDVAGAFYNMRTEAGYSRQELADRLRIPVTAVEQIEDADALSEAEEVTEKPVGIKTGNPEKTFDTFEYACPTCGSYVDLRYYYHMKATLFFCMECNTAYDIKHALRRTKPTPIGKHSDRSMVEEIKKEVNKRRAEMVENLDVSGYSQPYRLACIEEMEWLDHLLLTLIFNTGERRNQ